MVLPCVTPFLAAHCWHKLTRPGAQLPWASASGQGRCLGPASAPGATATGVQGSPAPPNTDEWASFRGPPVPRAAGAETPLPVGRACLSLSAVPVSRGPRGRRSGPALRERQRGHPAHGSPRPPTPSSRKGVSEVTERHPGWTDTPTFTPPANVLSCQPGPIGPGCPQCPLLSSVLPINAGSPLPAAVRPETQGF